MVTNDKTTRCIDCIWILRNTLFLNSISMLGKIFQLKKRDVGSKKFSVSLTIKNNEGVMKWLYQYRERFFMLLFYYIVVFPMTMNEGSIIFYVLVSLVLVHVLVFTLFLLCHTTELHVWLEKKLLDKKHKNKHKTCRLQNGVRPKQTNKQTTQVIVAFLLHKFYYELIINVQLKTQW